ncbi:MAG: AIR synthase-related protein, partial [Firmicutes bacterium]|nr:AIR synthase-related protein [Bacillota bacterium]
GVEIVGGHTERTDAVFRPVICAAAAGAGGILPRGNIRPGDSIVMTKTAGLEGTFVLAGDYADVLRLTEAETAEAQSYLDLLCVAREAAAAAGLRISAMHDATEGGVLGAVSEMLPAGMGADIDGTLIPVTSLTKTICARLNLDPFKLLSSGSMIFVTGEETALTDALQRAGIGAAIIGRVSGEPGVRLNGKTANDFTDEIYRINDV